MNTSTKHEREHEHEGRCGAVAPDEPAVLDSDRLDAYRVAVQFASIVSRMSITPAGLRD